MRVFGLIRGPNPPTERRIRASQSRALIAAHDNGAFLGLIGVEGCRAPIGPILPYCFRMSALPLLTLDDSGLYCPAGGFHIDPWRPARHAVITHAHTDHAHWGNHHYLCTENCAPILRARFGAHLSIQTVPYGRQMKLGDVTVSMHPAGHVLGSAQIRLEISDERPIIIEVDPADPDRERTPRRSRVCVVSGDYKTQPDPTAEPFEPVTCDTFITESTFGLPIYRWPAPEAVFEEINAWWRSNIELGRTSVIYAYALGKAQRLLRGVDASIGPVLLHGAIAKIIPAYEEAGVTLCPTQPALADAAARLKGRALVIAPPSAQNTPWLKKFSPYSDAVASGWSLVRGTRRWRSIDRAFVLSDHADWPALNHAIDATGARSVGVTHGTSAALSRWLRERGRDAFVVPTRFQGESGESDEVESTPPPADNTDHTSPAGA